MSLEMRAWISSLVLLCLGVAFDNALLECVGGIGLTFSLCVGTIKGVVK